MTPDETAAVLETIDRYCDLAPRATADVEQVGPFTLYVAHTGWPFYARPQVGLGAREIDPGEVREVFDRQRVLGVPVSMEWIHDRTPSLLAAARAAGAECEERPLLVRTFEASLGVPDGVTVTMLEPDGPRFDGARAAVSAGFGESDELTREPVLDTIRARAVDGHIRVAGAFNRDGLPLGGGTSVPRGDVCELTGIAVPPRSRGLGIGAALTALLAADAAERGATTIWLSATDERVARVYERAGFTRIGTSCEAETAAR